MAREAVRLGPTARSGRVTREWDGRLITRIYLRPNEHPLARAEPAFVRGAGCPGVLTGSARDDGA